MHGGTVEAASPGPGKGSRFTVRLPLISHVPQATSASDPAPAAPELRGCRILIVDDNADAADTLRAFLGFAGCEASCAYDGTSALEAAARFRPEVVLLDLGLPDIDGYEVLRRLRASAGNGPAVIALSGFAQPSDLARIKEAGFDARLRKPAASDALMAAIASVRKAR